MVDACWTLLIVLLFYHFKEDHTSDNKIFDHPVATNSFLFGRRGRRIVRSIVTVTAIVLWRRTKLSERLRDRLEFFKWAGTNFIFGIISTEFFYDYDYYYYCIYHLYQSLRNQSLDLSRLNHHIDTLIAFKKAG